MEILSDSDTSLPDLFIPTPPSRSTRNSHRKSINELLQDTISVMEECKTDYMLGKKTENYMEDISQSNIINQGDELVMPASPVSEAAEEVELNFFCVNNYLQYFNLRDITLQNSGYATINQSDLTQFEELLITSKPVNIESVLSTIVSVFSTSVVESCFKHMKPFAYFLMKILSVHENEATVQACERILRIFLNTQSGIMFTSEEIFILLFNYGVDIKNFKKMEIFEAVPEVKMTSKSYSCSRTIPLNWLYNFEVLLSAVEDLISNSCFTNSDLSTIIKYFLGVYLDSLIQNEYIVISQLKKCTSTALEMISQEGWPDSFTSICKFIMSLEKISALNSWHIIYQVGKFLPNATKRMSQIQCYISLTCLKKLSGDTTENEPSLQNINCNISDLQHILESIHLIEAKNYHTAIKFLDICISHLNLVTKEEYEELYFSLKRWEDIISNSEISSLKEQDHLVRICTKIFLMTPDQPSDMDKQIENIKCEFENEDLDLSEKISSLKIVKHVKKEVEESDSYSNFCSPLMHNYPKDFSTEKNNSDSDLESVISLDTPLSIKPSIVDSCLSTVSTCAVAFNVKKEQEENNKILSEDNVSILSFCSEKLDSPLIPSSPLDKQICTHPLVENVSTVKKLTHDEEIMLIPPIDCFKSSSKNDNFSVRSKLRNSRITNHSNELDNYNSVDYSELHISEIASQSDTIDIDNKVNSDANLKLSKSPSQFDNTSVKCSSVDELKFLNFPKLSQANKIYSNINCDFVDCSEPCLSSATIDTNVKYNIIDTVNVNSDDDPKSTSSQIRSTDTDMNYSSMDHSKNVNSLITSQSVIDKDVNFNYFDRSKLHNLSITESENKLQSSNELKLYKTTTLTTSVTINTPSDKTTDTKSPHYYISSDIGFANQSTDPISDIHVTISASHTSPVPDENIIEPTKCSSDSNYTKLASDQNIPDVYIPQMQDDIVHISDSEDDDDDIQILDVQVKSCKRTKKSGGNHVPLKRTKLVQSEKAKSSSNVQSLFNFGRTSPIRRIANSTPNANTSPPACNDSEPEIQILYNSMDDDCQIISHMNEVVTLD